MNKQGSTEKPYGGIEWTHIFGPRTGRTANPVRGCKHGCRWRMPDGRMVICYAKSQKERMSGKGTFEQITWHPDVLAEIEKTAEPCGIFIDSMSDLFGQGVETYMIERVFATMERCRHHAFFSLTKNPSRLRHIEHYPDNLFLGISAPPTFMFEKELTPVQQATWLRVALKILGEANAKHKWVSLEPLSFPVGDFLREHRQQFGALRGIEWAVIGAGSDGARKHQPGRDDFANALAALSGLKVFFKGNIDRQLADELAGGWRAEYPSVENWPN